MQESQKESLFTELTAEEAAAVNGAYRNCTSHQSNRSTYYQRPYPRQHYMYYPRRERSYRTLVVLRYH